MTRLRQSRIATEIVSARDALKAFDRSLRRLAPMFAATMPPNGVSRDHDLPRTRLSAKARATMVLQGRYMGFMRQLKPRQKARIRKIREMKGVRAAISTARQIARS